MATAAATAKPAAQLRDHRLLAPGGPAHAAGPVRALARHPERAQLRGLRLHIASVAAKFKYDDHNPPKHRATPSSASASGKSANGNPATNRGAGITVSLAALKEMASMATPITTQIVFDPSVILNWARKLRHHGIDLPVRVGSPERPTGRNCRGSPARWASASRRSSSRSSRACCGVELVAQADARGDLTDVQVGEPQQPRRLQHDRSVISALVERPVLLDSARASTGTPSASA